MPSLGTNGQYCVCVKPEKVEEFATSDWSLITGNKAKVSPIERSSDTRIELYSEDFTRGTYRITQPGYYVLMEDIELEMNAPSTWDDPNAEGKRTLPYLWFTSLFLFAFCRRVVAARRAR